MNPHRWINLSFAGAVTLSAFLIAHGVREIVGTGNWFIGGLAAAAGVLILVGE